MIDLHQWISLQLFSIPHHADAETSADSISEEQEGTDKKDEKKDEKKDKLAEFADVVKECERKEGLFCFYLKPDEGKVLLEILPDQLGVVFLCSLTREAGDGSYFDSGSLMNSFPFVFTRTGKMVQLVQKNVRFRAERGSAIEKAIQRGVSDSIMGSAKVECKPHPERGSILVNANSLFVQDIDLVGPRLNEWQKTEYNFDADNSYISLLKPYEANVEIEVTTHFKSTKPKFVHTMADPRSFLHRYHFSISRIPETDYRPRIADDRVGHFLTLHQDYTDMYRETPYVRYVERWHLEKADPDAEISPPKKPIVFWIENTIPDEYRGAVAEGILLWNDGFERIGFKDAIVVKQQPDDADWEAGDIRYNTIRWIVMPGAGYAVGPSRANPFTGELYHADIRISADFIRSMLGRLEEFVTPVSTETHHVPPLARPGRPPVDDYQRGLAQHAAFGYQLIAMRDYIERDDPKVQQYLHDAIVHLVVHEVGHTLGLRHNFKASSVLSAEQLHDVELTSKHGLTGSVMDYIPVNLAPEGMKQGQYWQTNLGPYDYWVIDYAYRPMDGATPEQEQAQLEKIASAVVAPELVYGTDEDAFSGPQGIDPTCNRWDLGSDPVVYHRNQIALAKELWGKLEAHFSRPGTRYQKLRQVFQYGLSQYQIAAMNVPKFVGGIYHRRDHIGDPGDRVPFEPVSPAKQREALALIVTEFFSADAFQFSPTFLNKLAPERFWDFDASVWGMRRLDYPLHEVILSLQRQPLDHFYAPLLFERLLDIELQYESGSDAFTLAELFQTLREAIWDELESGDNITSFRRALQRLHLQKLLWLVLHSDAGVSPDACSLARADLTYVKKRIGDNLKQDKLDTYTRAHLDEARAQIKSALKANVERRLT